MAPTCLNKQWYGEDVHLPVTVEQELRPISMPLPAPRGQYITLYASERYVNVIIVLFSMKHSCNSIMVHI